MTSDRLHDASLRFDYDDQRRARLVERSVRPELEELADERSRASVSRDGATLSVRIEAGDLVALRAAANTWQTLIEVAERSAAAVDLVET
ncbi:KEOPS complex subunit Pcc1 [Halalkalicoccus subterraneus]|uniref:KEOPS complex subunit Pcc1 n=1 Tax=Halalkalicoccus subterraneus TaxID=2675002 RepID=UPI000EFDA304|nr:KEOPS complex subunit Pcc1 [Halalkalicoccus subterraneus]